MWKLSYLLEAAHKSLVSIMLGLWSQGCLLAPTMMETMLHLLRRYRSLPVEETLLIFLPSKETLLLTLHPEEKLFLTLSLEETLLLTSCADTVPLSLPLDLRWPSSPSYSSGPF
ncbi:hypothetical protein Tco_1442996 [Tanacetum coccineum]